MRKLLGLVLGLWCVAALAADPPYSRSKIAAPTPEEQWIGALQVGLLAGYGFEDQDTLVGGFVGYTLRFGQIGVGAELDVMNNPFRLSETQERLENWLLSARMRAGFFLMPTSFVYATAGWAWASDGLDALVWGGGLELAITERFSLRGEVLKYEFDNEQTLARVGLAYRF